VQGRDATPMHAQGKRLIMLSSGMKSTEFKAEAFTDVPMPTIVTEQNLLPRLKMSSARLHRITSPSPAIGHGPALMSSATDSGFAQ
jgi:hypothetical protein